MNTIFHTFTLKSLILFFIPVYLIGIEISISNEKVSLETFNSTLPEVCQNLAVDPEKNANQIWKSQVFWIVIIIVANYLNQKDTKRIFISNFLKERQDKSL